MPKFDAVYDKLQKEGSDRDAAVAKEKCPKKKKPAIFAMVVRSDDMSSVSGVNVDVSKPTSQKKSTDGEGVAKFDPAKAGAHVVKVDLTKDQKDKFFAPLASSVTTSIGKTSTVALLLDPKADLTVKVIRVHDKQPMEDLPVRVGTFPELPTAKGSGQCMFRGIRAGNYRVALNLSYALAQQYEVPTPRVEEIPAGSSKTVIIEIEQIKLELVKVDPHFAPSIEKLDFTYHIFGLTKKTVKLQILGNNTLLYERDLTDIEKKDGDNKALNWDGKMNQGANKDLYAHPLLGRFKVRLFFSDRFKGEKPFDILFHSMELGWGFHTTDEALPPDTQKEKYAQARLNLLGYDGGPVNGVIGSTAQNALKRFQRANYKVGKKEILDVNGTVDAETLKTIKDGSAKKRERWETGKDPLKDDCKLFIDDNFFTDPVPHFADNPAGFITSHLPQFSSGDRKTHAEDLMERPYLPLEVTIKLLKKDNTGVAAPDAVGPAPVAWEASDGAEDDSVIAGTNALAKKFVKNARQFGVGANTATAARIDADGDNSADTFDGYRKGASSDTVKQWFPDDNASILAPYKVDHYVKETRAGKDYHQAIVKAWVHATDHTKRKGKAGVYFRHSQKGGDDAKVRASISFDGATNKAELAKIHEPYKDKLFKETGRWTVWRRMRISAYCQQGVPTRNPANPNWAWITAKWKEAFIEVENNGQPLQTLNYSTVVTEAVYKDALMKIPVGSRPAGFHTEADLHYRANGVYGGPDITVDPNLSQQQFEGAQQYSQRIIPYLVNWTRFPIKAVLGVFHREVRKTSPEGLIIYDYSIHHDGVNGYNWNGVTNQWELDPAHTSQWPSDCGYVHVDAAVTMDVHNTCDVSCYVLHEAGHSRFLLHHITSGASGNASDNVNLHDANHVRCTMSYMIDGDSGQNWKYSFCGKCLLRLRGWGVAALPNKYTP